MDNEKTVWMQIEEDQQDYQYFKNWDNEQLKKELEAIKKSIELEYQGVYA